jgi:hypothetical protein
MVAADTYSESLTIKISLNVIGAGAQATIIDGGGVNTVVAVSSGTHVALSGVTVRHGRASNGAGIYNQGTLTINNATVSGNLAFPRLPVSGEGGGGILNSGALTINNSTISGNGAGCGYLPCYSRGGGILNYGTLYMNNSTVTGNGASGHAAKSEGGGIYTSVGFLTVANSTISGNSSSNGEGDNIWAAGASLENSIVAGSANNCYGIVHSNGYNLSSDNSCNFTGPGDMNNIDPLLGPLQNNGGPTETLAEPLGSPTIDAGNPSGCTDGQGHLLQTDQRGFPRPGEDKHDHRCDMGAYESQTD